MNPQTKNYIEQSLNRLTNNIDLHKFQTQIQNAIDMKKNSTPTEEEFFAKMLLNIEYFIENKKAWVEIFLQNFGNGKMTKIQTIQNELLLEQMKIRENLSLRMNELLNKFKSQAKSNQKISYDYAFASIENSLRIDVITLFALDQQSQDLLHDVGEELIKFIDKLIYDQVFKIVNQLNIN
ncbi:DNA-binding ferritin-like protein (Dps family) [Lysinibacillus composti]|uniref:Uncharacterized protein n=1 Tax=Lysinibacillus composti TaxID=720633 RepID=A0A3N9UWT5_9BACI|nr:hypothetical protein [Lysinibacillus composti]MBM7607079.1 DNA-binding ferritin-like protein (Dps family) [Lysinibacillus composti]RQW76326.1 hypothetical protein EBB45_01905 [Lysinibacillus composti]